MNLTPTDAQVAHYELEIEIQASREKVWTALVDETNAWWLPDYHQTGADSVVTFDAQAGGALVERAPGGASLLWYNVLMVTPQQTMYLVGHSHADYGGPATSWLKITLEEGDDGTVLRFRDDLVGHISESCAQSLSDGWTTLFRDGLKAHAER